MNGKAILKILKKSGWVIIRVKGSHYHLFNAALSKNVTVPVYGKKDLKIKTVKSIERATQVKLLK